MADKYDNNGYGSEDFKRAPQDDQLDRDQDGEEGGKLNEKVGEYMRELLNEKIKLEQSKFPISAKLVDQEVTRVQSTGRLPARDHKYVDVYKEKPVKVTVKVLVPVKEHPKFNFVGKLLGPKGNTMKHLQEETMCKMAVLGRGSMRDRQKEEDLRNSLDPKYAHLSDELHVEVSALGPPAEAHARIAYALAEVRKYLVPDANDMIRQSQMREIVDRSDHYAAGPGPRGPPSRPPPPRMPHMPPAARPHKKVISILDRARTAMEDYSYEDPYAAQEPQMMRGPPRAEADYYGGYDRNDRYYEDDYYKEEATPSYKTQARDVGTRRPAQRPYGRPAPYSRPAK